MPVEVLIPKTYHKGLPELLQAYVREPHARVMGVGREVRAVDRQGRELPFEIGLAPIHTKSGTSVVAAIADITIRKYVEREIPAAKFVQEAMPPRFFPQVKRCEIGGATRFVDALGGDFPDCVALRCPLCEP